MEFLIVFGSIYVGVGLYEFYKSSLLGSPFSEALINALVWPVDMYYEFKDLIRSNYIDRDGP